MKHVLAVIVVAQFLCTSVWFASNAVINDVVKLLSVDLSITGHLTSAVQLGFITGTLVFALLTLADRFSPSVVFFVCSLFAAIANAAWLGLDASVSMLMVSRFCTGFFLAGIYPVGMKIASDYYQQGLGKSLGWLVGALVLGTSLPHVLKGFALSIAYAPVFYTTSGLSVAGGILMLLFVRDGPYRKTMARIEVKALFNAFKNKDFRAYAFGYFGHMWELYTFWAYVPIMVASHQFIVNNANFNVSMASFIIIACGGVACVVGGLLSQYVPTRYLAFGALLSSCICCLLSPIILEQQHHEMLVLFLCFWGIVVVADSPLFSSLIATHAPPAARGSSLTIVNCIGFSITILSIQTVLALTPFIATQYIFTILAVGPAIGLFALWDKVKRH